MSDNLSLLSGRKGIEDNLFEKIVESGKLTGSPSEERLRELAYEYLMGSANTVGAASFYDFLNEKNLGKKAYVCNGSACMVAGTQDAVQAELEKHLDVEEIGHMCCLGRCHETGAFHFDGKNYSAKSAAEIGAILGGEAGPGDDYYVGCNMEHPILTAEMPSLDAYYRPFLDYLSRDSAALLAEIKTSGIRGRGGAGFPIGIKLESCRREEAEQKFIVCNADEGDPGAYSDRYLLQERPHSVLLGMMIAGFVTGAERGVLYIRAEYPAAIRAVRDAITELEDRAWIGENVMDSGFNFLFKVIEGAGAYVCGEETALINSIEGQRGEVRVRPPYPTQAGLFNLPTAVNNVETLALLPTVLKSGGNNMAGIGTEKSTGSKLICLDSFFNRPGLYEVAMGTPLSVVVEDLGQGFREPVKALHIGGPLGGIVPVHRIADLTVDFESFSENGFLLGHAGVISIPESFSMLKYLEHLFEFTAVESCGKCFPCSIGSVRGQELLQKAGAGELKIDRQLFDDLLETLEIGSLCALGGGLPQGVKNALEYFEDELKTYFEPTRS